MHFALSSCMVLSEIGDELSGSGWRRGRTEYLASSLPQYLYVIVRSCSINIIIIIRKDFIEKKKNPASLNHCIHHPQLVCSNFGLIQ